MSASEGPFTFGGTVSLSCTTASGRVAVNLPAAQRLVITSLGPDLTYIQIGDVTVAAAVATSFPLLPGSQITLSAPAGTIYVAGINPTSTSTIKVTSGDGQLSGLAAANTGSGGVVDAVTISGPLGQAAMAASIPVVVASDQSNLPVAFQASATGGATYKNVVAGQATTVIKGTPGTLYAVTFNSVATATNVTTIYDNATTSGLVIAIPQATLATGLSTLQFGPGGLAFTLGLTVITTTANGANMTFVYK